MDVVWTQNEHVNIKKDVDRQYDYNKTIAKMAGVSHTTVSCLNGDPAVKMILKKIQKIALEVGIPNLRAKGLVTNKLVLGLFFFKHRLVLHIHFLQR